MEAAVIAVKSLFFFIDNRPLLLFSSDVLIQMVSTTGFLALVSGLF